MELEASVRSGAVFRRLASSSPGDLWRTEPADISGNLCRLFGVSFRGPNASSLVALGRSPLVGRR